MASVCLQKENYFVWDDRHDGGGGSKLLHSQALPGRKSYPSHHAGNAEVSNTRLASSLRNLKEQRRRSLRNGWPPIYKRDQGSEGKESKSSQPKETEQGWAEKGLGLPEEALTERRVRMKV